MSCRLQKQGASGFLDIGVVTLGGQPTGGVAQGGELTLTSHIGNLDPAVISVVCEGRQKPNSIVRVESLRLELLQISSVVNLTTAP